MICLIHGYLLDGSGSNLWTRSIVQSLCRQGETVHLVCQEYHPEHYDFISTAYRYHADGVRETLFDRQVPYAGRAIIHKPQIGETLPVYVWDRYEEFSAVPMVELSDDAINHYLDRNTEVLMRVVREQGVSVMHVNHAVLMSVVAERVGRSTGVPFAIMPHGSDIEYAIKKDERFLRLAEGAFRAAGRVFVIGREMRERAGRVFAAVPEIEKKMVELNLGVDTSLFEPIGRDERRASIGKLARALTGLPRGKTREMSEALVSSLDSDAPSLEQLQCLIQAAAEYDTKRPDADLEAKLDAIDWAAARTLLFVGRIISSKGLQSIIAALPLILDRQPAAKLIVAGHGPLREAMEVMLWALERGGRKLVEKIVEWGSLLEGAAGRKPLVTVRQFYDQLQERGELDDYFEKARRRLRPDSVVFTGYLTHSELRYLFPSADVAIFPSVVAEAGPLVFLEALASGCFPLGTYFAGMAASIDSVAAALPDGDAEVMKLSAEADRTVADIASKTPEAVRLAGRHKRALREVAVERYEWSNVARRLASALRSLNEQAPHSRDDY